MNVYWSELRVYSDGSFYIQADGPANNSRNTSDIVGFVWGRLTNDEWMLDDPQPGYVKTDWPEASRSVFV